MAASYLDREICSRTSGEWSGAKDLWYWIGLNERGREAGWDWVDDTVCAWYRDWAARLTTTGSRGGADLWREREDERREDSRLGFRSETQTTVEPYDTFTNLKELCVGVSPAGWETFG